MYPVSFDVEYPDRELSRLTTFFRIFMVIPIAIVLGAVSGERVYNGHGGSVAATAGGILVLGPVLMILFREKYPRWWFDWNLELIRFSARVAVYVALMDDRYPSTDDRQGVRLDMPHPQVGHGGVNRWLPLVKWFLAIPHYFVLVFLDIGAFFVVIFAWFAILFTGRFPRGAFDYLVGVGRWYVRVVGYMAVFATDEYPPFRFAP